MIRLRGTIPAFVVAVSLLGAAAPGRAALIQVGSRADLGADFRIDWSVLGPSGTILATCICVVPLTDGLNVDISAPSGALERRTEGIDVTANFALGDALLVSPLDAGPDVIFTETPTSTGLVGPRTTVSAIGTQITPETPNFTGPFTATITVLTTDLPAAHFTISGNLTHAQDNSAPFFGVVSTTSDIVEMFVVIPGPDGLVGPAIINQVDVRVPEPASLALLSAGLAGFGIVRRRQAKSS